MADWSRSTWNDAGQIVLLVDSDADPGEANGKALPEWYGQLIASGEFGEAVRFLAHAMPRFDCVVWATQVFLDCSLANRGDALLNATLRWIDNPDDDRLRRKAGDLAEAAKPDVAARYLALAAFYSGGSIGPEDLPPVPVPPDGCAKAAAGAIILGAHTTPDADATMRQALSMGEAIITGAA